MGVYFLCFFFHGLPAAGFSIERDLCVCVDDGVAVEGYPLSVGVVERVGDSILFFWEGGF